MAKKAKYYQRKDGLFETIRTINGKRVAFRGKTCAEVDRKLLAYHEDAEKGRYVPDIVDEWFDTLEGKVVDNTIATYKPKVKRMKQAFAGVRAGEVETLDVMRALRDYEAQGYSHGACSTYLSVMRMVFDHALLRDVRINPANGVKLSKGLPAGTRRALTEEEERKVFEFRGDDWLLGYMLAYTGCRRGELLALEWKDIDRKAGVIHITKKYNRKYRRVDQYLKSKNGRRDIPLFDPLAWVLPKNRIGLLFPAKKGGHIGGYEFDQRWTAYRDAVGLGEDVVPHCFRHTMATICYEAGMDSRAAARVLGDTVQVVERVYTELREKHHKDQVDRLNAFFQMREEGWKEQAGGGK